LVDKGARQTAQAGKVENQGLQKQPQQRITNNALFASPCIIREASFIKKALFLKLQNEHWHFRKKKNKMMKNTVL
jgi:transcription initiation factor TFIID subunit TAF12